MLTLKCLARPAAWAAVCSVCFYFTFEPVFAEVGHYRNQSVVLLVKSKREPFSKDKMKKTRGPSGLRLRDATRGAERTDFDVALSALQKLFFLALGVPLGLLFFASVWRFSAKQGGCD